MFDAIPHTGDVPGLQWRPDVPDADHPKVCYRALFEVDEVPYVVGFHLIYHKHMMDGRLRDYFVVWDMDRNEQVSILGKVWRFLRRVIMGRNRDGVTWGAPTNLGQKYGQAHPVKVLSCVMAIVKVFLETVRPAMISYEIHRKGMYRIYQHLAARFGGDLGYEGTNSTMLICKDSWSKHQQQIKRVIPPTPVFEDHNKTPVWKRVWNWLRGWR